MSIADPRSLLADLFHAAVAAADPMEIVPRWLPERPKGRTVVVGAGKASARMALAFERAWAGDLTGVVVTRYDHGEPCERIEVLEAAHPVPDSAGLGASQALFDAVRGLGPDDLVVALMSGGGSSLLPAPPPGLGLADEQALNAALLRSGLAIGEMNLVRKHVSMIKGGRLAAAAGSARLVTLVLSDVPGDDPSQVASGPTIPSPGTRAEALQLVERARLTLPAAVMAHLRTAAADAPDPSRLARHEVHVIGSAAMSLRAASARCEEKHGLAADILSDAIEGDAREVGQAHAILARRIQAERETNGRPLVLLSGGETTVAWSGVACSGVSGRGGRNTEYAMSLGLGIEGVAGIHALAADTDGIDGSSGAVGGFADGTMATRMQLAGVDPMAALAAHDSGSALDAIGDLLVTGPTRTNVNDFRAILIEPS